MPQNFAMRMSRILLTSLLALPIWNFVRAQYAKFIEQAEIDALGAGKDGYRVRLSSKQLVKFHRFDVVEPMIRRYGTNFNTKILGEDRIVTSDPAHLQRMFSTDFQGWEKGDNFRRAMGLCVRVGGTSVEVCSLSFWIRSTSTNIRKVSSLDEPAWTIFFQSRQNQRLKYIFCRHSADALNIFRSTPGASLDYQGVVFRRTLDSAAEFLFGVHVDSFRSSGSSQLLGPALSALQHRLAQRIRTALIWPLFELTGDKTRGDLAVVQDFIRPIITAALEKKTELSGSDPKTNDMLLDELVDLTDGEAHAFMAVLKKIDKEPDPKLILDLTMNVLVAGRDTTAATITFLTYCLATHPHILLVKSGYRHSTTSSRYTKSLGSAQTHLYRFVSQFC
ncbi:cytochrome P450 [Mycena rosella]|uniref:Cytochrome P450 n=1 Tax=Mycena rosella TaxID=1033263 RepID=A0AAD7D720_MYCRO|nr:cytochrome P450 [Mycena rosella]